MVMERSLPHFHFRSQFSDFSGYTGLILPNDHIQFLCGSIAVVTSDHNYGVDMIGHHHALIYLHMVKMGRDLQ